MKGLRRILSTTLLVLAFVLTNILVSKYLGRVDMTSSKLYSLSDKNREIIEDVGDRLVATLFLGDNIPASFQKLKSETEFFLRSLHSVNGNIWADVFDPTQGSAPQLNAIAKIFADNNVNAVRIRVNSADGMKETRVYPYVHLESKNGDRYINILEGRRPNETEEDAIFRSIQKLESKITKGVYELSKPLTSKVAIVAFEDLVNRKVFDLSNVLRRDYQTEIISPKTLFEKRDSCAVAILPVNSSMEISKEDLVYVDQYLMLGGKLFWLVEEYGISVDSINKYGEFIPESKELSFSDYLFHHGVKINGTWLSDWRSSRIPQVVGEQGGRAQTEMFNYPYHPVMEGSDHLISKDLKEMNLFYPTVIEMVNTASTITKTPLIQSSEYSTTLSYPHIFSFDFLKEEPSLDSHGENDLITGLLVEGHFESYFKNRINSKQSNEWSQKGITLTANSEIETAQIIVTDQDMILPKSLPNGRLFPIGYNTWERRTFEDNKRFMINAIDYLINGEKFLMPDERAEYKLAALDKRKVASSGRKLSVINLLFAPFILLVLHLGLRLYLKKRYA